MGRYLKVKGLNILLQALFNKLVNATLKYPRRIYKKTISSDCCGKINGKASADK
jgi:hypothetical protein